MALTHGQSLTTLESAQDEYFDWSPENGPVSVHMHLDAMDGIARDVVEGLRNLPPRGLEVGGLLLGRVETGERPIVWIERYQRVPCQHRFGPQFVLDAEDKAALEGAAANILQAGELAIVGLYRSHTRQGFQLEAPDFELTGRYFSDPSDLILLIKPEGAVNLTAQFYAHAASEESEANALPLGEPFPFRGHGVRSGIIGGAPEQIPEVASAVPEATAEPAVVPVPERPRRLVPDFVPSPVEPAQTPRVSSAPSVFGLADQNPEPAEIEPENNRFGSWKKWLLMAAALMSVGGALWFILQPARHESPSLTPAVVAESGRPLGLSVEPAGAAWRVSWNPNATALHDARRVQLFVREGDDQNRIDLSARELAVGTYEFKSPGNDVTFRLEASDSAGRVSAESFRFVRAAGVPVPTPVPTALKPSPVAPPNVVRRTEPRAIHKAPPLVAAGIRPRIRDEIAIDVRVHVDARGRVVAAAPVTKPHSGLESYLAASAVQAARQWRFDPARENGQPVAGTQTIHFRFQR